MEGNNQNRTILIIAGVAVGLCLLVVCGGAATLALFGGAASFAEGFSEGFSESVTENGGDFFETTREDTISYGGSSTATLGSLSEAHNIYFDGSAGDQVVIEALGSGGTDPRIRILDPSGNRIAEDDDGGTDRDSYLELTLPETGQYTIRVDVFSTGSYEVTVDLR